ncbi:MAG: carboxypeptidase-like regulatory domain-containing protein [Ignavibacteriae bacterium]|nr:carboxypeptidase-like regulatory domain-containing protein [Ignavibacteriota bacterium]
MRRITRQYEIVCAVLLYALFVCGAGAQQRRASGIVVDRDGGKPLPFTHVLILGSSKGTTSDLEGRFVLPLDTSAHRLRFSRVGYSSVTMQIHPGDTLSDMRIMLRQTAIKMRGVTVTAGEDPAVPIIRKAIEKKRLLEQRLFNYAATTHTKTVLRILSLDDREAGERDPDLRLPTVGESLTQAYWAKPDQYKEIIEARRSSDLDGPTNTLTSITARANFSRDRVQIGKRVSVIGPISEDGLSAYYYTLMGETSIDSTTVYIIRITPRSAAKPLVAGTIYITDGSYLLNSVDIVFNEAALPPMIDTVSFRQQYSLVDDEFWLPSDVSLYAHMTASIVGIEVTAEGRMFSIIQNYRVNKPENEEMMDGIRVKVLEGADLFDSTSWRMQQRIPNTEEELRAYTKGDSVHLVETIQARRYSAAEVFTGTTLDGGSVSYSLPGLLTMYHYNRVEGHAVYAPFSVSSPAYSLRGAGFGFGYGLSDARVKWHAAVSPYLHLRTGMFLVASAYSRLASIDEDQHLMGTSATTALNLFVKEDPRDYYRSTGGGILLDAYLVNTLHSSLSVSLEEHTSVATNTQWSLAGKDTRFRANPPINEGKFLSLGFESELDFRPRIDDAGVVRRSGEADIVPKAGITWTQADTEHDRWSYLTLSAGLSGTIDLGILGRSTLDVSARWSTQRLPTQDLFHLTGSSNYITAPARFRTLGFREFGGDAAASIFVEQNLGRLPFSILPLGNIPVLGAASWELIFFGGAGWTSMRSSTGAMQTVPVGIASRPFFEAGFSIEKIFTLFRLDLAWRLDHFRSGRNFFIGFSTSELLRARASGEN